MQSPRPFGIKGLLCQVHHDLDITRLSGEPFGPARPVAQVAATRWSLLFTSVDKIRLERVVNVMQQFIKFPKFDIDSMLMNSG